MNNQTYLSQQENDYWDQDDRRHERQRRTKLLEFPGQWKRTENKYITLE